MQICSHPPLFLVHSFTSLHSFPSLARRNPSRQEQRTNPGCDVSGLHCCAQPPLLYRQWLPTYLMLRKNEVSKFDIVFDEGSVGLTHFRWSVGDTTNVPLHAHLYVPRRFIQRCSHGGGLSNLHSLISRQSLSLNPSLNPESQ